MVENVLRAIGGIGVYDTISICLFVTVFSGVILRVFLLKKSFLNQMSSLPMDDGEAKTKGETSRE